jgi:GT2 family glycosyltransferase
VAARGDTAAGSPHAARVDGKFLAVRGRRFLIKGVAYGTFAPDARGVQFPAADVVERDFSAMAAAGINTVRTYTCPPSSLLDAALRHDLRVMVGLAWPQHVPFLADRSLTRSIRRDAVETVRELGPHPAALLFALGNEIPPGIVRWLGHRRVERFLRRLYEEVKAAAPESLLTYVNYPPTEYLELDAFDVCAFNVYLHREQDLRGYLARLQHLAGTRPLLLAEAGGDSIREGGEGQAKITSTHLAVAFEEGACGAVAYSWTDEWWRGGRSVDDWAFGLVDEERRPKPALAAVSRAFVRAPFPESDRAVWPRASVVVCAHDAEGTLGECLESLAALTYPEVEVIVVDDGSRDGTGAIARAHRHVRLIETPHLGLGAARNAGLAAATGEIVAYTDADVRVDPDWLTYLVRPLLDSDVVGVGGPNVVPPDDPWVAQCVARAPGGPIHVMLDDRIAEHVPGCNMAFWREALLEVGGFNPVYVRAGDDVDICWRLQARKLKIGFAPAALVWHRHRASVGAYWRQQVGYGEAEAWLDAHHPEKFLGGHMIWRGRIYSPLPFLKAADERRVNTGVWGTAAFPSVYGGHAHSWRYLPHSPAWVAVSAVLFNIGFWGPLAGMDAAWLPLIAGTSGGALTLARCAQYARRSDLRGLPRVRRWSGRASRWIYRGLIAWLHFLQPLARFRGRLRGLSRPRAIAPRHATRHPWRPPLPMPGDVFGAMRLLTRRGRERTFWGSAWVPPERVLTELVGVLRAVRPPQTVDVDDGWHSDRDFSLAVGRWGWLRVQTVMEAHEGGACVFRVRARLRPSFGGTLRGSALAILGAGGMSASVFLYDPVVTLVVAALAILAIGAASAWQAIRGSVVLERAVDRVTRGAGLLDLAASPEEGSTLAVGRTPVPATRAELDEPPAPGGTFDTATEPPRRRPAAAGRVRMRTRTPE